MYRSSLFLTALVWCALGSADQIVNVSEAAGAQARRPKGISAATAAYVRAMPTLPSSERLLLLDQFVRSIKDILPRLDLLYITAGHDEDAIAINLVAPGRFTLTPVNRPTFLEDRGVRGGGGAGIRAQPGTTTPTSAR